MKHLETYKWLTGRNRAGTKRLETLSWKRLAQMYFKSPTSSPIRKLIAAECRRLGYTPRVILGLNT